MLLLDLTGRSSQKDDVVSKLLLEVEVLLSSGLLSGERFAEARVGERVRCMGDGELV